MKRTKCIQTANGFLAVQGNEFWFESAPVGWVLLSPDHDYLDRVAKSLLGIPYWIMNLDKI